MKDNILIGIAGLLISVLTYFAGVWRTEKRLSKNERNDRIRTVLNKYMEFLRDRYTSGIDGLQKAGVAKLHNNSEIRDLIELITQHGVTNPLGNNSVRYNSVDLKAVFDYTTTERVDFSKTSLDEIVAKIQSKA